MCQFYIYSLTNVSGRCFIARSPALGGSTPALLCTSFGGLRAPVPNTGRHRCASVSANLAKSRLGGLINTDEDGGVLRFSF